uniref:Uncharacterized protein n=1 Tax=Nelumbo nucifera TaxID=4432 RepID=A0A822Z7C2_NELNU|nr:TPA_asm: hypothetical protein HUJ06_014776 [Nelumbo nucifera]
MRKIPVTELFSTKRVQSYRSIREEEIFHFSIDQVDFSIICLFHSCELYLTDVALVLTKNIICRIAFGKTFQHEGWVFDILSGLDRRLERNFQRLNLFYNQVIGEHLDPKRAKRPKSEN